MNEDVINKTFYEYLAESYKKMLNSMIEINKKLEKENSKISFICTISLLANIMFILIITIIIL